MTVEYGKGYKDRAEARLRELDEQLSPQARWFARGLREAFKQALTQFARTEGGGRRPGTKRNT